MGPHATNQKLKKTIDVIGILGNVSHKKVAMLCLKTQQKNYLRYLFEQ